MRTRDAVRTRRGLTEPVGKHQSDVGRVKQARGGSSVFSVGETLIWKRAKTEAQFV